MHGPCTEIGVVAALPAEVRGLRAAMAAGGSAGLRVAVAGIGPQRAAAAAGRLVDEGARALVSWGVAGGLDAALAPGDLLLPGSVETERDVWPIDTAWRAQLARQLPAARGGRLWCSRLVVSGLAGKQALAARGMAAVDMESAAVAAVAAAAALPFVAIKAVCDPAGRALPALALDLLDAQGRLRLVRLPGAVLAGPRLWRELMRLRADFALARRALRQAAVALLAPDRAAPDRAAPDRAAPDRAACAALPPRVAAVAALQPLERRLGGAVPPQGVTPRRTVPARSEPAP